jgi:hypothetical protein
VLSIAQKTDFLITQTIRAHPFNNILHLSAYCTNNLFRSGYTNAFLYKFITLSMLSACLSHLILSDFLFNICEEHAFWNFSIFNFLQSCVIPAPSDSDIFARSLLLHTIIHLKKNLNFAEIFRNYSGNYCMRILSDYLCFTQRRNYLRSCMCDFLVGLCVPRIECLRLLGLTSH